MSKLTLTQYCIITFTHGSTALFTSLTVCKYVDRFIQNTKFQLTWSDTACCSSNHSLSREAPALLLGESGTPPKSGGVQPYPCCPPGVTSWLDPSPWIGHLEWTLEGSGRDLDGQRGAGTCSETGRGCGGLLDPAVKKNVSKNMHQFVRSSTEIQLSSQSISELHTYQSKCINSNIQTSTWWTWAKRREIRNEKNENNVPGSYYIIYIPLFSIPTIIKQLAYIYISVRTNKSWYLNYNSPDKFMNSWKRYIISITLLKTYPNWANFILWIFLLFLSTRRFPWQPSLHAHRHCVAPYVTEMGGCHFGHDPHVTLDRSNLVVGVQEWLIEGQ